MIVHIYEKNKKIFSVYANSVEEVKENPTSYYKDYSKNMIVSNIDYQYPVIEGNSIREMTKEEKVKQGMEIQLEEGEVVKNKKLLKFERPSKYHKWENNEWIVNLEEVKESKREELKIIRTNKLYENITINEDTFQVRKDDLENFWEVDYMLKKEEVTETDTRNWVLADNSIKTFTYSQILKVLTEFIKRKAGVFNKFTELSIKLGSCKTIEEIKKIEWK